MKKLFNRRFIHWFMLVLNFFAAIISISAFIKDLFDGPFMVTLLVFVCIGLVYGIASLLYSVFYPMMQKPVDVIHKFHGVIHMYKDVNAYIRELFENTASPSGFEHDRLKEIHELMVYFQEFVKDTGVNNPLVSLKLYRTDENDTLFTYCRGNNCSDNLLREGHDDHIPIRMCTSFDNIVKGHCKSYFVGNNLIKDHNEKKYYDYRGIPPYSSSLVVPIRILCSDMTYDIVGFLCIDSKKANQFIINNDITKILIDCTRSFADCLYDLISESNIYYDSIVAFGGTDNA